MDLEEMQRSVENPRSRVLVAEAVKCYQNGLYRASLVSLWVAVVSDLTYKIKYLSDTGDRNAKKILDRLIKGLDEDNVPSVQSYERELLSKAEKELEIILKHEKEQLDRLSKDRNRCAHPAYDSNLDLFVPDAEQVRAHLAAAYRIVFSQRPIAGKALIEQLHEQLRGFHWAHSKESFLDIFFTPARGTVKSNIVKSLINMSVSSDEGGDVVERSSEAVYWIAEESRSDFEDALKSVLGARSFGFEKLIKAFGLYGSFPEFWSALGNGNKIQLEQYFVKMESVKLSKSLLEIKPIIYGVPCLEEFSNALRKMFENAEAADFAELVELTDEYSLAGPSVIKRLQKASSFVEARAQWKILVRYGKSMDAESINSLREAIEYNDEKHRSQVSSAFNCMSSLESLYCDISSSDEVANEWKKLVIYLNEQGEHNLEQSVFAELLKPIEDSE
ncbi:hypothetical protein [Rothia sp. CCM 9419]|uniref:hypothetical protein n=1 Tax=Rothia sp. CCM 9419 TaxID=3402662 RepID=UPI003AEEB152